MISLIWFGLVICLLGFSLLVTTRQYVGNPIDCVHTKDIPEVNSQTWILLYKCKINLRTTFLWF